MLGASMSSVLASSTALIQFAGHSSLKVALGGYKPSKSSSATQLAQVDMEEATGINTPMRVDALVD